MYINLELFSLPPSAKLEKVKEQRYGVQVQEERRLDVVVEGDAILSLVHDHLCIRHYKHKERDGAQGDEEAPEEGGLDKERSRYQS